MKPKIPIVCGPTGSGKSALAMAYARATDAAIINADSMQVYRGLDIGTAKPSLAEREEIPHYLIGIVDPTERFSVANYIEHVKFVLEELITSGKKLIIVGGTPQYITALLEGIRYIPDSSNQALRQSIERKIENEGGEKSLELLRQVDPKRASLLHSNDTKRIARALEIYYTVGLKQSQWDTEESRESLPYDFYAYGIQWERPVLYERINLRVDRMLEEGILDEAKTVYDMHLTKENTARQAIGYKEFFPYFRGEMSLEDCIAQLKQSTRRYAKRQLTWYRKMPVHWFSPDTLPEAINYLIENF